MKNPLNKAMKPLNKETAPDNKGKEERTMNGTFQKVVDLADEIRQATPETKEDFLRRIEQAKTEQARAAAAKETAENETEFDKACDDAIRAREKEGFYRRQLEIFQFSPRMDEEQYFDTVESVDASVKAAAESFKATAEKAIAEIIQAKEKYLGILEDADEALRALDTAANVLQSKYRYRIIELNNMDPQYVEDSNEWTRHAIRYGGGKGYDMAARIPGNLAEYNKKVVAAWMAAERATK